MIWLLACGGDTSLVTEGHNEAPEVTLTAPAPDTRIFVGETGGRPGASMTRSADGPR